MKRMKLLCKTQRKKIVHTKKNTNVPYILQYQIKTYFSCLLACYFLIIFTRVLKKEKQKNKNKRMKKKTNVQTNTNIFNQPNKEMSLLSDINEWLNKGSQKTYDDIPINLYLPTEIMLSNYNQHDKYYNQLQ